MTDGDFKLWINQKRLRRQLKWAVETSLADGHTLDKVLILGLSNAGYDHIMQAFSLLVGGMKKDENHPFVVPAVMDAIRALQLSLDDFDELNDEKGEEPFPAYTMGRDPITLDAMRDEAPE